MTFARATALILVILPLLAAADQVSNQDPPPGNIRLIDGFRHERLPGIDSFVGRIWKPDGVEIKYDIGVFAGNRAAHALPADRAWTTRQIIAGRPVEIVKTKDAWILVTFSSGPADKNPANFYAKVATEKELADVLAITLTYSAVK